MNNNYSGDPIDREKIGEYFPEIFEVFSHTGDGKYVFVINIKNNFSYWSDDAAEYFGLPANKFYDPLKIWGNRIDPHDRENFFNEIEKVFSGELDDYNITYRIRNSNDEYVTCSCRGKIIRNIEGEMLYFAGNIVNHQKNSMIDYVTGLYNRDSLFSYLKTLNRENKNYYLLVTGIKQFFKVNYSQGYDFGNHILSILADMLREISDDGIIFRTEGTKAVLLFNVDKYSRKDIEKKYNEVLQRIKRGIEYNGSKVFLTIYACLYFSNNPKLNVNTIYNCAMFALNKAKKEEKEELLTVTDELFSGNKFLMEKLDYIRNCIPKKCEGFYLVYQPIVSADSGEMVGAGALIRWKNKTYGFVPPNEFIEWLEGDSMFYELGNWIIRQAIRDMREVIEEYPELLININLAYPQLQNINFNNDLCRILKEEKFDAINLNLELTERCKFANIDNLRSNIAFFKSMGIKTALDDFGTGYSALNLMVDLQVDEIKIDKSFVNDIDNDKSRQSLLKAITTCADELGKRVCVEGIETDKMAEYLYNHFKVTKYQGYYFSEPLEKDDFVKWTINNKKDFSK